MGFWGIINKTEKQQTHLKTVSLKTIYKQGCNVCPLNNQRGNKHPHMDPYGSDKPVAYILGEAPGEQEDRKGIPFVGKAGRTLHLRIPEEFEDQIRFNNCVRTRPPKNRDPAPLEIECCRPSIIKDIEETKPPAIFGFGNVPLHWVMKQSNITAWTGRRIPVKIGNHTCWFFPIVHPSYAMRTRKFEPSGPDEYGSETEFAFAVDVKNAFAALDDLTEPIVHTKEMIFDNIELITGENGDEDVQRIIELLNAFYDEKIVGFDYETNALRPYVLGSKILTVGLANKDFAFSFPLKHSKAVWTDDQYDKVRSAFKRFLYEAPCRKVAHNLAFELEWSALKFGRKVIRAGRWGDTLSQAYVIDERSIKSRPGCHSLEFLCIQNFGFSLKSLSKVDVLNLDNEPLEPVLSYNALDARYHRHLYMAQNKRLEDDGLTDLYRQHVSRVPTMVLTQIKGVPVDQATVTKFYKLYTKKLEVIEAKIADLKIVQRFKKITGKDYRPSAPKDINFILRKMLHIPEELNKEGRVTNNEKALEKVKHPIARLTLKWRKANKIRSTYVIPIKKDHPDTTLFPDGLIHPVLSTNRTKTSRTSSDSPNSQNYPKHENREIRSQIKAGGDLKIVAFDFAGIQARNVAMESKDKALVKAFWNRYDIHSDWMMRILKKCPDWVPGGYKALEADSDLRKLYRNKAKNGLVFPSFFGAQAKKVSFELGIDESIAQSLHDDFWGMFPDISGWHDSLKEFYLENGYVTGLSGYRRRAPVSQNELINAPIQADEALIVCDAMTSLSKMEDPRFQANMEIHDDLTFIWPKHEIEKNAEIVIKEMIKINYDWINVPLAVEMLVGDDWASVKEVGAFSSDNWNGKVSMLTE